MSKDKDKSLVKECYEDGFAEINGRKYEFGKINHKTRLKIFGYANAVMPSLLSGNYAFMGSDEYKDFQDLMFKNMILDGTSLTKLSEDHFEKYGEDYIILISMAMQVFCYPFTKGTS